MAFKNDLPDPIDRERFTQEAKTSKLKVKAFLKNIRNEILEIRELQERRSWLWGEMLPKGMRIKDIQVQTSHELDKLGDNRAEAYDLDNLLKEKLGILLKDHMKAQSLINQLQDSRQRLVLELYYLSVERKSWTDVADKMGFSESVIFDIHGDALANLEKIYLENETSE